MIRRSAPLVALLVISLFASLPTAQGMTQNDFGSSEKTEIQEKTEIPKKTEIMKNFEFSEKTEFLSDTLLSTDTDPIVIRSAVRLAWVAGEFQWSDDEQWYCFDQIIKHESAWNPWSDNGAGWEETGGIPQAHPSRKMASAGADYRSNVWTQVRWGLEYIESVYGTPCAAWDSWQDRAAGGKYGWY